MNTSLVIVHANVITVRNTVGSAVGVAVYVSALVVVLSLEVALMVAFAEPLLAVELFLDEWWASSAAPGSLFSNTGDGEPCTTHSSTISTFTVLSYYHAYMTYSVLGLSCPGGIGRLVLCYGWRWGWRP